MPPPARGCPTKGRAGVIGIILPIWLFYCIGLMYCLPKEIIEWITAGVDLGYHLIKVTAKLVDTYFLSS